MYVYFRFSFSNFSTLLFFTNIYNWKNKYWKAPEKDARSV